ncbi:MAG TPA: TlpA disulfide reductase family protein, partial [Bacteroidales bacterium]|nr:TlpA disulfide reductase family protein [Bacteroidales bacterium]
QDVDSKLKQYNNVLLMSKLSDKEIKGTGSINLEIPDQSGKVVSLNSLNGKVVLINFWASSNQASREANQRLKAVYNQYHSRGFEVYSVSLDNNKSAWMDAVRFEEYSWIDVCELTFPNSYAASVYNIQNLPATFLLDREGNIVAKNISGRNLGTWLDNLL